MAVFFFLYIYSFNTQSALRSSSRDNLRLIVFQRPIRKKKNITKYQKEKYHKEPMRTQSDSKAGKLRLVGVWYLIGRECYARFLDQSKIVS